MIDVNPKPAPVIKPESWTPLYAAVTIIGVLVVASLAAIIIAGVS